MAADKHRESRVNAVVEPVDPILKLNLGCGKVKMEGFLGVDILPFEGLDVTCNLGVDPWPWPNESVSEIFCSHFLEHLDARERVWFWNELYRVLKPKCGGKIITPYWGSARAYGDPTHKWPPIAEWSYYYISKEWRKLNAPHCDSEFVPWGFNCDFDAIGGYGMHQALLTRTPEYQNFAIQWYKEAAQDLHMNVTKK